MTTDPLDRLRASNPVPLGSSAPPLESILARVHGEGSARRGRTAWTGALVPALGAVVAIAVLVAALLTLHHRSAVRHSAPATRSTTSTLRSPVPVLPAGGMRGLVFLQGAAFASSSDGLISLQQCLSCHNGNPTAHASYQDWLAATADGGASWRFTRRPWYVFDPRLSGSDGWAEGLQALSNGGGIARFYVTHDNGRDWGMAPSAASALGNQPVSVGGGEVWAVGSDCAAARCTVTVMRGPVNGSRLVAAPAQPVSGGWTNVAAVAAGPHTAYVTNPDAGGQTFVTHNDGRSWQRISPPCPHDAYDRLATSGQPGSLWASCQSRQGGTTVRRYRDSGHSWQLVAGRFTDVFRLQPVSAQVAWGLTPRGAIVRTADGGLTWNTVWSAGDSQPASLRTRTPLIAALASGTPILTVQSATSATVVMIATRGHVGKQARFTNLVVYRSTDGGAAWQARVVRLPQR